MAKSALFLFCLLIACSLSAQATHDPQGPMAWVDRYTGAHGQRCCGQADCEYATVALLGEAGPGQCELMIGSVVVVVPCDRVHRSEEAQGVVCRMSAQNHEIAAYNIRCAFPAENM